MTEGREGAFTPAEARRLARLIATFGPDGASLAGVEAPARALLRRAVSAGLVEERQGRLVARNEAAGFLRRLYVADGEQAFSAQHGARRMVEIATPEGRRRVRRNLDESPLSTLSRLKGRDGAPFLPQTALAAGERLAVDFERGQLQPRLTVSFEPRLSGRIKGEAGGQADLADAALAARRRFNRAAEAMGPELAGVAIDVCCFCKGLETVERERQWPVRSAKLMLRVALMALARHYDPPRRCVSRPHHWGAEDFRPAS